MLTIGVPVYNGAETLERCLGSVLTFAPEDAEIVISDNASTDDTPAICRRFAAESKRVRVLRQAANVGPQANFWLLPAQARTPYFMWLADDDWLGDDFVEQAVAFLESNPGHALATAPAAYYDEASGACQFTTLTASIEDEDPVRRVIHYLENLTDNSEFYGVYRRSRMPPAPPRVLGFDWIATLDTAFLGKIRSLDGCTLNRRNRWTAPGRNLAVAESLSVPSQQAAQPHYATALAATAHIGFASPTFAPLGEAGRVSLLLGVLRGFMRHQRLPERLFFWPDARRLLGEAQGSSAGHALRALLARLCCESMGAPSGAASHDQDLLELALLLNLGTEPPSAEERSAQDAREALLKRRGDTLAAFAYRALFEPAYRNPRVAPFSEIPPDCLEAYARHATAPERLFESEADVEAYRLRLEELIDSVLPPPLLAGQPLRLAPQRLQAIAAVTRGLYMAPCYFSRASLRELMEKRARLGTWRLQHGGTEIDAEIPGGAAGRRLRVGLLLRDVNTLTDPYTALPAIAALDRARFETVVFVTSLEQGGAPFTAMEQYGLGLAERWTLIGGDVDAMAAAIRRENLDFLLIGSNTTTVSNPIFLLSLCRLARWQVAFNPCCTTTGSPNVDYFVSGTLLEARGRGQEDYSEALLMVRGPGHVRLSPPFEPGLGCPAAAASRDDSELRLVSGANYFKLTPATRTTWARLLARLPQATLHLYPFGPTWSSNYDVERLQRLLGNELAAAGVDPARTRLIEPLASVADIRRLLGTMDIYLDSFPFSGINSLLDPLMAGIPAVTLAGDSFRSNMGASVLEESSLGDWIAADPEHYLSLVAGLAKDRASLRAAKQRVHESMLRGSRLFDSRWYSGEFARLFEDIAAGRAPERPR